MFPIAKRVLLFLALNMLIVVTLSAVTHLLGIRPYLNAYGLDYTQLIGFCLVWGMGGALISLSLSRIMAKWTMGVEIVDPQTRSAELQWLVSTVHNLSRAAGLPKVPEVGIYDSPELNAFATGPTRSRALVAVSTGLMHRMNHEEIEGVLGHEIAHVANGDMVTMTLIQGVVNAFVMFLSRVIAFALTHLGKGERESETRSSSPMAYFFIQMGLEIVFMILGSMVVALFSRWREFRADAGGAKLAGRDQMIRALKALQRTFEIVDPEPQAAVQTLKISGHPSGIMRLFSTHPPLEERIARLEKMA